LKKLKGNEDFRKKDYDLAILNYREGIACLDYLNGEEE
jgi:hypothetical protein